MDVVYNVLSFNKMPFHPLIVLANGGYSTYNVEFYCYYLPIIRVCMYLYTHTHTHIYIYACMHT